MAAIPVPSSQESNAPSQTIIYDEQKEVAARLVVFERSATARLQAELEYLYDQLSIPYPPPL